MSSEEEKSNQNEIILTNLATINFLYGVLNQLTEDGSSNISDNDIKNISTIMSTITNIENINNNIKNYIKNYKDNKNGLDDIYKEKEYDSVKLEYKKFIDEINNEGRLDIHETYNNIKGKINTEIKKKYKTLNDNKIFENLSTEKSKTSELKTLTQEETDRLLDNYISSLVKIVHIIDISGDGKFYNKISNYINHNSDNTLEICGYLLQFQINYELLQKFDKKRNLLKFAQKIADGITSDKLKELVTLCSNNRGNVVSNN